MSSRANPRGRPPPPHQTNAPSAVIPRKRPANADAQEEAWVAEEDQFVLRQAKRKALIRVKGGRAKPIDWLAVTLRIIDPTRKSLEEDENEAEVDLVDPEGVFEGLNQGQLEDLSKEITAYMALETNDNNRDFWKTMQLICNDRLEKFMNTAPTARGVSSVTSDVDRLLGPKSYEELEVLEKQIRGKLSSNEAIDVDYWEHLLKSLMMWKARAKLRNVSQAIVRSRLEALRRQQQEEAQAIREKLSSAIGSSRRESAETNSVSRALDPEPLLKLPLEDKGLESVDEDTFLHSITDERRKVLKLGYVPVQHRIVERPTTAAVAKLPEAAALGNARFATVSNEDFSQATSALYEREVARGVNEDEEIFTGEETVVTASTALWENKFRPRKPRYFNRVQMGYEWNKYNQTHYDHDNPPPKVVQGYKFNIFYPDLIDKTKAPTYRIEREGGRKRGQSFAPAGEEDTCLIRFMAGPPYEDIAFRIVDKEWDYSAKRERGFRSSFDKGILQLHFQFKKIYYRK
ncbi:cactin [Trichodelitschia bisporula]|uniref:Splicing factor Cactin n=1 Tax=Trichodelitschia bisporula TaxID=703511 RepID=A0A6G1I7G4_9PEZI|nr:cactin [Trichodelitschia bisporula]